MKRRCGLTFTLLNCSAASVVAFRERPLPQPLVGAPGAELETQRQITSLRAQQLAVHLSVDVSADRPDAAITKSDVDQRAVKRGRERGPPLIGRQVCVDAPDGRGRIRVLIGEVAPGEIADTELT